MLMAQNQRWQQRVKYKMDVQMDVSRYRLTGKQVLEYSNNSPDTIRQVFYHLYWNAFQPNSMMDTRSRELGKIKIGSRSDWDGRVRDRIYNLKQDEIGYQHVISIRLNGVAQKFKEDETILQVALSQPVLPKQTVLLEMEFEAQVPLQIRRSGRTAANGVELSMSQWYPKICEYDQQGWHPNPYIAREFYGVWGDFDVSITIDRRYILGGTGNLTNASAIGYGYEAEGMKVNRPSGKNLTWRFSAPNVHDFVWAADTAYEHIVRPIKNGPVVHVLYKAGTESKEDWMKIADAAEVVYPFIRDHFGEYPYRQYTFIQGGDGGMEYPMATLLNGPGLGTAFHEWMHSWYQMMLATNESLYAWMDEGFTEFATDRVEAFYYSEMARKSGKTWTSTDLPAYDASNYDGYFSLVKSGREEPLSTHADHFNSNFAYSLASYSKGCVFLTQLGYIIGDSNRDRVLKRYYQEWRFRHPDVNDFMRIAEKESGLQLDWYKEYWVNSVKTIDYAIDSLWEEGGQSKIRLRKISDMPMPIDLQLTFKDNTTALHYIPMYLMFGEKPAENNTTRIMHPSWKWTHSTYTLTFNRRLTELSKVEIDPSYRMADINRKNNLLDLKW
jgi:hypothetical protein